jgi:hypothetical protein
MITLPTNQKAKSGLTKTQGILIIIFAIILASIILYLLKFEPVYTWINDLFAKINTINFNELSTQILSYFTLDPVKGLTTIISVACACGTLYGLYNNWKKTQLNEQLQQQALEAQLTANNQIYQLQTQAQQEAQKYQNQIIDYQNKIGQYTDIQTQLNQANSSVETLTTQLNQKQATITELSRLLEQLKLKTYETIVVK